MTLDLGKEVIRGGITERNTVMTRIPAMRIGALFGTLIFGLLSLSTSSASASPVLVDDHSATVSTSTLAIGAQPQLLYVNATIGDRGDAIAHGSVKGISGDWKGLPWNGMTMSDGKVLSADMTDTYQVGIFPSAAISSILFDTDSNEALVRSPANLPTDRNGTHRQQGLFSYLMAPITSVPLSLPLFGLALVVLALIARRNKRARPA
jgi:hypothetical protein